ncbi:hypothetical protein CEN45_12690 [Fischerella thermalis CCMEE 5198]|nr:hypothetical protein CEN45_12690 [Fischerella thermalis CCMEE 5198]PMB50137.1 hypothetical protein CEN39_19365 [Fischerella thermalis CCMEE 5201]
MQIKGSVGSNLETRCLKRLEVGGVWGVGGVSSFKNKQQPTTNNQQLTINTIKSKARVKRARAKEIKIN